MDKESFITTKIHVIRGSKVILDYDLAELYETEVRTLNQAVKRNTQRFPKDFIFQLNINELEDLRSQTVIANSLSISNHKRRTLPYAFTEAGAFALSFVLKSPKACEMGIFIIRAFTHLRRFVLKNENLMMELKNNENLSLSFRNFEKRIEQDLIVLYRNNSKNKNKMKELDSRMKKVESNLKIKKP